MVICILLHHLRSWRTVSPTVSTKHTFQTQNTPLITTTRASSSTSHVGHQSLWMAHGASSSMGKIQRFPLSATYSPPIYPRHCADILSFANNATVVGEIAPPLMQFLKDWVQTASDYYALFAKAFPHRWVKTHQPILSRHGHDPNRYTTYTRQQSKTNAIPVKLVAEPGRDDHILITKFSFTEPAGLLLLCNLRCGWGLTSSKTASGVQVVCSRCGSKCVVSRFYSNGSTTLGRASLVAVRFPQQVMYANWGPPARVAITDDLGPDDGAIGGITTEDTIVDVENTTPEDNITKDTTIENNITKDTTIENNINKYATIEDNITKDTTIENDTTKDTTIESDTTQTALRRSRRKRKLTPKAAELETPTPPPPPQPTCSSKGKRKATSLQISPPPMETRSNSLPAIRLPRHKLVHKASSPALSNRPSTPSSAGGSRSITATPPPHSPLERPDAPERTPGSSGLIRKKAR